MGRRTWLKREVSEFPGRLKRLSSVIWNGINKIPNAVGKVVNHVVKGATKGARRVVTAMSKIVVHFPGKV